MSSGGSCCTSARISSAVLINRSAAAAARVWGSGIVSLLTEQLQCFLDGPVGKRKEDGLVVGGVYHRLPARHDEDVPRLPVNHEVRTDACLAPTFDRHEDRRVGGPVPRGLKSLRQELD